MLAKNFVITFLSFLQHFLGSILDTNQYQSVCATQFSGIQNM
jgi:hypothetical protein